MGALPSDETTKSRQSDQDYRNARNLALIGLGLTLALVVLPLLVGGIEYKKPILSAAAVAVAVGAIVLFLTAYFVPKSEGKSSELLLQFLRDDGYPSLSRLQFFLWTSIIVFAFTWIAFIRLFNGVAPLPASFSASFPANLLAVMGISTASAVASSQVQYPAGQAPTCVGGKASPWEQLWGTMLQEPRKSNGAWTWAASLGRFQMLGWTVVSIGIYLTVLGNAVYHVWTHGSVASLSLPDIDTALLVLMGISHVGYVGSKYSSVQSSSGGSSAPVPPPAPSGGQAPAAAPPTPPKP